MRRNILILYHERSCFSTKLKPMLLPAKPEVYLQYKLVPFWNKFKKKEEEKLEEDSTCAKFAQVQKEGTKKFLYCKAHNIMIIYIKNKNRCSWRNNYELFYV